MPPRKGRKRAGRKADSDEEWAGKELEKADDLIALASSSKTSGGNKFAEDCEESNEPTALLPIPQRNSGKKGKKQANISDDPIAKSLPQIASGKKAKKQIQESDDSDASPPPPLPKASGKKPREDEDSDEPSLPPPQKVSGKKAKKQAKKQVANCDDSDASPPPPLKASQASAKNPKKQVDESDGSDAPPPPPPPPKAPQASAKKAKKKIDDSDVQPLPQPKQSGKKSKEDAEGSDEPINLPPPQKASSKKTKTQAKKQVAESEDSDVPPPPKASQASTKKAKKKIEESDDSDAQPLQPPKQSGKKSKENAEEYDEPTSLPPPQKASGQKAKKQANKQIEKSDDSSALPPMPPSKAPKATGKKSPMYLEESDEATGLPPAQKALGKKAKKQGKKKIEESDDSDAPPPPQKAVHKASGKKKKKQFEDYSQSTAKLPHNDDEKIGDDYTEESDASEPKIQPQRASSRKIKKHTGEGSSGVASQKTPGKKGKKQIEDFNEDARTFSQKGYNKKVKKQLTESDDSDAPSPSKKGKKAKKQSDESNTMNSQNAFGKKVNKQVQKPEESVESNESDESDDSSPPRKPPEKESEIKAESSNAEKLDEHAIQDNETTEVVVDGEQGENEEGESITDRSYGRFVFNKKKKHKKKSQVIEEEVIEEVKTPAKGTDVEALPEESQEDDDWEAMAHQLLDDEKEHLETSEAPRAEVYNASSGPVKSPPENHNVSLNATAHQQKKGKKGKPAIEETIPDNAQLRSPILCIMGHVDTGKTKLLDKIRRTNVQDKEAGGITQQIGATFFPRENLLLQCAKVERDIQLRVPGLLIIDTPGHASFNNLRKRGSSLCDIAILVVDIMHGLEPQTRESIGLLRQRKCPFVVALNKMDRLYGWVPCDWQPCKQSLDRQKRHVKEEFDERVRKVLLALTSEEGLNCEIYWKNPNVRKNVSVVPTSAITGEGIADLLTLIVKLTQQLMVKQIILDIHHIECTVLEVKTIEGLGTTIDVILISGILHEGDTIIVCGMNGPIVTTIRALLTPHPMKELRVKGEYVHHEQLSAAMGVKIAGNGLEEAVAGTSMLVATNPHDSDEIERLKDEVQEDMGAIFKSVDKTQEGVYVMASTLGSLEALLDFLKESKIPVSGINIGTVWKLDVKKASTMRERGREEFAIILAFDVKIDSEAEKEAKVLGVKIFAADIIYHLFDAFTKHISDFREAKKKQAIVDMIYPCVLTIIPEYVFNKKDPLILGVRVDDGEARIGTPLVVFDKDHNMVKLGKISSVEFNHKAVTQGVKGQEICVKITGDSSVTYGRQFDHKQKMYSQISRQSIDIMKQYFKEDLEKHVKLVVSLKKVLGIV